MKTYLFIKMIEVDNYKKANLIVYKQPIGKLIYLVYSIRLDNLFIVGKLSRYNIDS